VSLKKGAVTVMWRKAADAGLMCDKAVTNSDTIKWTSVLCIYYYDLFKTKYRVMSRDQNAGRCHSMETDNSFLVTVEEFKYLGTTLANQCSVQEEINPLTPNDI
jgi:hypothetical protein